MLIYSLVITLAVVLIFSLIFSMIERGKRSAELKERLFKTQFMENQQVAARRVYGNLISNILIKKIEQISNKFIPQNITENIKKKIAVSGQKELTVSKYFMQKLVFMFFVVSVFPLIFWLLNIEINYGFLLLALVLAYFLPDLNLKQQLEKRHKLVTKELPNFIDLLRICVEAGMDLEGGLTKISQKSTGVLQQEINQTITEIRMGKSVSEALRSMGRRIEHPDLSSFLTLLIQASNTGISISNILKVQSIQITDKYIQSQRARAAKIPIMIMLPMVFFILPALLMVVLGPIVISMMGIF